MLQVEDVTIVRGGMPVVRGLSLDVARGEVVALLGPSGAGKSSLLLAIAGLVEVGTGRIALGGRDVTALPPHRRGVGLVFQEYALFPHLDVLANLTYGLHGDGRTRAEHEAVARDWLDRVGLPPAEFAHRDVATLSGGQRQRVALARSLAPDPAVLLLDEPLGSLDRQLREDLLEELADVVRADDGPAVVVVTHDRDEAFTLGDRVGVLRDGELVALDTPTALWSAPGSAWVARFLGHDNVLEAVAARRLGLVAEGPVAIGASAVSVVPRTEAATVGRIVTATWRDGRRRVTVEVEGVRLVADVPAVAAVGVGDEVAVAIEPSGVVAI